VSRPSIRVVVAARCGPPPGTVLGEVTMMPVDVRGIGLRAGARWADFAAELAGVPAADVLGAAAVDGVLISRVRLRA
jgi:hypothetical protein